METYENILSRADLQQIAAFLIHGSGRKLLDGGSAMQRIHQLQIQVDELLEQSVPDIDQRDTISDALGELYSVTQNAYLELGLRAAFRMTQA